MTITAGKISSLVGDHHLFLTHRSHVDRLIRTRAWRKDHRSRVMQGFDQSLLNSRSINTSVGGYHLKPNHRRNTLPAQACGCNPQIIEPTARAAADLRDVDRQSRDLPDRLHISDSWRAR